MFITKKHLSRRTVLRGMGAGVSLPLLDAMIPPARRWRRPPPPPKPRMAFVYFPHGAVMDKWTPKTEGADFDLPQILAPLQPFQKQLTVISGLENKSAIAAPVHAITPGTWLSLRAAAHQPRSVRRHHHRPDRRQAHRPGHAAAVARSRDRRAAAVKAPATATTAAATARRFRSAIRRRRCRWSTTRASCSSSCSARATPPTSASRSRARTRASSTSCARDAADLRKHARRARPRGAGRLPRARCARSSAACSSSPQARPVDGEAAGCALGHPEQLRRAHRADVRPASRSPFQANLTRVASFMMAAEVSNQPYNFIGISDAFHPLSHHAEQPAEARASREGAGVEHRGVREVREEAAVAARRRGHRCWTTPSCCSAAT